MERRTFIASAAAAAATLATKAVLAQEHDHSKHQAKDGAKAPASPAMTKEQKAVVDATADCMKAGEVCLAHCTDNLAGGDAAMAECQRAVMNMLAVCHAMFSVTSYRSAAAADIKAMAKACSAFCQACAKACEKHAAHHAECKNCMESCKACAKACDALAK